MIEYTSGLNTAYIEYIKVNIVHSLLRSTLILNALMHILFKTHIHVPLKTRFSLIIQGSVIQVLCVIFITKMITV